MNQSDHSNACESSEMQTFFVQDPGIGVTPGFSTHITGAAEALYQTNGSIGISC